MSPHDPDPAPDLDELARVAGDPAQPRAAREEAIRRLRPFHRRRARCVLQARARSDPDTAEELAAHAERRLWEGRFDAAHGHYPPWCQCVMDNRLSDLIGHRPPPLPLVDVADRGAPALVVWEQEEDRCTPFSAADLARIRAWPNTRRVVVLCRSLLWVKVAEAEWASWLAECGLSPPFPGDGFEDLTVEDRCACLREALHLSPAALAQHWRRGRPELLELDSVRELSHDS
jgi:hypothetical protein